MPEERSRSDASDPGESPVSTPRSSETESPRERAKRLGEGVIGVVALAVLGHAVVIMASTESAEVWWEYFWRAVFFLGVFVLQLALVLDRPGRSSTGVWYGLGISGVLMVGGLVGAIAT